jgi:localization factor PodJL
MTAAAPWSVKGIDPRAREVAKDLARRSGMTLGEWLNRMIVDQHDEPAPGRYAQADPEPIPLEPSVRGLLGRIERGEREQVAVAARFEALAEELRTDQMRMAERLRRMEQNGETQGSTEALHALEQTVSRLAGHVYEGEQRAHDALRDLGACFVTLDGRLRKVEAGAGGGDAAVGPALDQLRREVAAIAEDVEKRLGRTDAVHAQSLEKVGEEVARISERLAERIANSERRSAMAIDEVGEQVSRVAERIHQRQERAAEDVTDRFRQSDERTAQLLEAMRAQIEASFAAAKTQGAAPATGPVASATMPAPPRLTVPMEPTVFAEPAGVLPSTREVIDQARAQARAEAEPGPARKEAFTLFPLRKIKIKAKGPGGSTLQTALFVTGTAAALGAGVASYMLGVADPAPSAVSGEKSSVAEPRMAVALNAPVPAPPSPGGAALYAEAVKRIATQDPAGVQQLKQAAALGYPAAQFHLARLYETGEAGLGRNDAEARRWTEQAARGGDGKAMHNLALYYFEGVGGAKDPATAAQWFRRAADRGLTDSQYNLGRLYEEGYGVARDPAIAYRWYLAAARAGDSEARTSAERVKPLLSPGARRAAETAAAG